MNDSKIYNGEDGAEIGLWKRVFISPNYAIDSISNDPYSSKDFIKATNRPGTIGDMMERSKELSEKRKEKDGIDPVKEQYYKEYKEKTGGKEHLEKQRERAKEKVKNIADLEF